jgi:signal transduction histidine kinase
MLLENLRSNSPMSLHEPIKSKAAPKPKKRKWCCNELVILLSAL